MMRWLRPSPACYGSRPLKGRRRLRPAAVAHLSAALIDPLACLLARSPRPQSEDQSKNFCSFAMGFPEERSIWLYQAKNLISPCSCILARCDHCCKDVKKIQFFFLYHKVLLC